MATLRRAVASKSLSNRTRGLAQVVPGIPFKPFESAGQPQTKSKLDEFFLTRLENAAHPSNHTTRILEQYAANKGKQLRAELGQSSKGLHIDSTVCPVYLIAHVASNGSRDKVCVSSGFKLQPQESHESILLTCAHTLEVLSCIVSGKNILHAFSGDELFRDIGHPFCDIRHLPLV